jgi:hypothetical protein
MTNRYRLAPLDEVTVVDWADVGDLFYGELTEDGDRPVLRPDHEARLQLITDYGHRYTLALSFGDDFTNAQQLADEIMARGVVNLDRWVQERNVYGSEAYQAEGDEAMQDAHERATDADYYDEVGGFRWPELLRRAS